MSSGEKRGRPVPPSGTFRALFEGLEDVLNDHEERLSALESSPDGDLEKAVDLIDRLIATVLHAPSPPDRICGNPNDSCDCACEEWIAAASLVDEARGFLKTLGKEG